MKTKKIKSWAMIAENGERIKIFMMGGAYTIFPSKEAAEAIRDRDNDKDEIVEVEVIFPIKKK